MPSSSHAACDSGAKYVTAHTDALAAEPWAAVGTGRAQRLVELVGPLVRAIVAGGGFMPGNPMGLQPLVAP